LYLQTTGLYADVDKDLFTPQGSYVTFDLYSLFYHCEGDREPTVIIEGGIGYSLPNWYPIQQALSSHMRTCVYDRAGYGMSHQGAGARTAGRIADELYILLKVAKIPGPYILVGHSFGGYVVQYFAKKNPQEVAGVVLVESSHPDQVTRLANLDVIKNKEKRNIITGRETMTSGGKPRDAHSHWYMLNSARKAIFTQMDELKYFKESAKMVRELGPLPDTPLAVITRSRHLLPTTENGHSLEEEWRDMQRELVTLSTQGWQTIAPVSGHSIHIDAPDVLVDEVLKILAIATEPTKNNETFKN
jgi:pimeloyl-ACP methyl ester carboxylesterase